MVGWELERNVNLWNRATVLPKEALMTGILAKRAKIAGGEVWGTCRQVPLSGTGLATVRSFGWGKVSFRGIALPLLQEKSQKFWFPLNHLFAAT
jgi:uncharacterized membrane protein YbjE (DUF340 family)